MPKLIRKRKLRMLSFLTASIPVAVLADLTDHPNVQFNYLRSGIGSVVVDMH